MQPTPYRIPRSRRPPGWIDDALLRCPQASAPAVTVVAPVPPPASDPAAQRAVRDAELASLLTRCAQGSEAAFERFYDLTVGHARALARRLVPAADLDDALAEAYLDAWRRAARYDAGRGSPVTWLLTIVHSRAIDLRRRLPETQALTDEPPDIAAEGLDPADRVWQAQAGSRLHAALATLQANERWALGLAYFRDLSHAAIAETTGMPLGTVKSLILRAQAKLRRQLTSLSEPLP